MDCKKAADFVKKEWNENVIPSLMDFVRIPNVSPSFDAEWDTNGLQLQAFELVTKWAKAQNLQNCNLRPQLENYFQRAPENLLRTMSHPSSTNSPRKLQIAPDSLR